MTRDEMITAARRLQTFCDSKLGQARRDEEPRDAEKASEMGDIATKLIAALDADPRAPDAERQRFVAEPVGRTGIGVRIMHDAGLLLSADRDASAAEPWRIERAEQQASSAAPRPTEAPPSDLVALVREWQAAKATIRRIFDAWDSGDDGPSDAGILGPVVQRRKDAEAAILAYPLPAALPVEMPTEWTFAKLVARKEPPVPKLEIGDFVTTVTMMLDEDGAEFYQRVTGIVEVRRGNDVIWSRRP